jgi:hypothetical protein
VNNLINIPLNFSVVLCASRTSIKSGDDLKKEWNRFILLCRHISCSELGGILDELYEHGLTIEVLNDYLEAHVIEKEKVLYEVV